MSNNPTHKEEWKDLESHAKEMGSTSINDLFASDPQRFENFSLQLEGLFFDYSKHLMTDKTIQKLIALAKASNIEQKRDDMFNGAIINTTENRAVLHTALRRPESDKVMVNDKNVIPFIHDTIKKMEDFSKNIRSGTLNGHTGKPFKHIVNIGIGGSDLGPHLVCDALQPFSTKDITMHFVFNIDGTHISQIFEKIDPETTLFIVASKSFSTQETITNAGTAKEWLTQKLGDGAIQKHFVALTSNARKAKEFGITENHIFELKDWVGGRYSLWSAIGLPICIAAGFDNFRKLLEGAYTMDRHFKTAPLEKNIPALMALLGIWYRNFWNMGSYAVLTYAHGLNRFPAYLQQLDMESNGKNIDRDGNKITDYKTSPVVFGEAGANGQHAFYQLIHQGTNIIPCDFIAAIHSEYNIGNHHDLLLGNMLAQGQALMQGQRNENNPFRNFDGNRPSSTILINRLDACHLGMLIALYEHKTFVQGIIWNINSFDQFGVELGKELAHKIENQDLRNADNSTKKLYSLIHKSSK